MPDTADWAEFKDLPQQSAFVQNLELLIAQNWWIDSNWLYFFRLLHSAIIRMILIFPTDRQLFCTVFNQIFCVSLNPILQWTSKCIDILLWSPKTKFLTRTINSIKLHILEIGLKGQKNIILIRSLYHFVYIYIWERISGKNH